MDIQHQPNPEPAKPKPGNIFTSPGNVVAIYTVLTILITMKQSLGLEAMLEYIENYLKTTEKQEPAIKPAVAKALSMMSIEKIYREANRHE